MTGEKRGCKLKSSGLYGRPILFFCRLWGMNFFVPSWILSRRSFQRRSTSTSGGAALMSSHFSPMKEAKSSHWADLYRGLSLGFLVTLIGWTSSSMTAPLWSDMPGTTLDEITELWWLVMIRSRVFDTPWCGSCLVGSMICCVRPWLAMMSFSFVCWSGCLHPGFSIGVPMDQSQSGRLKSPPSMTRWFVRILAREDASSSRLVLSDTSGWWNEPICKVLEP